MLKLIIKKSQSGYVNIKWSTFQSKNSDREKEVHFTKLKGSVDQKVMKILNFYESINRISKYMSKMDKTMKRKK